MREFLLGANFVGCLVVALFFLRFWRQTHDRLFAFFSLAFGAFAVNWAAVAFVPAGNEARTLAYAVRLVAFVLIIIAVAEKNRPGK